MRATHRPCVALTTAALWAIAVEALDYRRFDGVHRIAMGAMEVQEAMEPQITKGPLLRRADESACGTDSSLCPSSLNGGCCMSGYSCGTDSCYATTRSPSVCQSKTGWSACPAVYEGEFFESPDHLPSLTRAGGCCPEGYDCETGAQCIPPSTVAYTFGCPASYKMCPSSLGYGCCPSHMGCASNQCYSTEPVTETETVVVTTTEDGSKTTIRSTQVTVTTPEAPTGNIGGNDGSDQAIFKYFPTALAKAAASASATSDADGGGGGNGLSTGALAGIIAGSIAFLIIVLVAAYIIIRHLNKVVQAISTSKQSDGSKSQTIKHKPTDSEIDAMSVDPFLVPRPPAPGPDTSHSQQPSPYNVGSPNLSSNDHTPSGGTTTYHAVAGTGSAGHSRQTSFDAGGDYFHDGGNNNNRISQHSGVSAPTTNRISNDSHGYTHVRNWSNGSDGSDGPGGAPTWNQLTIAELEAQSRPAQSTMQPQMPELPMSPSSAMIARDERRRSSGGSAASNATRPVGSPRQRNRSESLGQLGVVDEEMMHGFFGPADHLVGQTDSHRPGTKDSNRR